MSEIKQKIEQDLKTALKKRDSAGVSILRLLLAEIHNKEIDKKNLTEDDITGVLVTAVKKHKDSIAQFSAGNRPELVAKEEVELRIIQTYLPPALTEKELKELVRQVLQEMKPERQKDFGKVMKNLMPKVKGKADGTLVSRIVKEELNNYGI